MISYIGCANTNVTFSLYVRTENINQNDRFNDCINEN